MSELFEKLLNKTKRETIFIIILLGILLMVIALPTSHGSSTDKSSENLTRNNKDYISDETDSRLEEILSNIEGVGEARVITKKNNENDISGIIIVCEGGANQNVVNMITDAINSLLGVPVHKIKVMKMSN